MAHACDEVDRLGFEQRTNVGPLVLLGHTPSHTSRSTRPPFVGRPSVLLSSSQPICPSQPMVPLVPPRRLRETWSVL